MSSIKTYVVHVKGDKAREAHITKELTKHHIPFQFMLDGNIEDITDSILEKYFGDSMKRKTSQTSCALKHILIYEEMIKNNVEQALIFEDDIELTKSFNRVFSTCLVEIENRKLNNYAIFYENTNLLYIKKSEAVAGQILYEKKSSRYAGAYLLDIAAAKGIIEYIKQKQCDRPIDWLYNKLAEDNSINIYWSYPPIAEQASHNGKMQSLLDGKKYGFFRRVSYFLQKIYKKEILYKLR